MEKFFFNDIRFEKLLTSKLGDVKPLTEQPDEKMPGQIERFGYKSNDPKTIDAAIKKQDDFFKNINNDVNNFIKGFGITSCVPYTMIPLVVYVMTNKDEIIKKLQITDKELIMFLKATIGIIGRETTFTKFINFNNGGIQFSPRYFKKNVYHFLNRYEWARKRKLGGLTGSYGPAQMQRATWNGLNMENLFNMNQDQLYTIIGAGMATITNLVNNYKLAKSLGYTTSKSANIAGTGNASLDISIAAHNIGKPIKWCKTNDDKYAAPCNSKDRKYLPFPKTQPNFVLQVLPQEITNYIPNKKTEKYQKEYNNIPLTTHGYIKEVSGYMSEYGCIDGIEKIN